MGSDRNDFSNTASAGSSLSLPEKLQPLAKGDYHAHGCGITVSIHNIDTAPAHVTQNRFLLRGYRGYLSLGDSLRSAFVWSNETVNIWTHGIGFFYFLLALVYDNAITLPVNKATWEEHFIVSVLLLSCGICMFCSFGYHMFNSHSASTYVRWLQLDLVGISLASCASFISGTYFGFTCFPTWRRVYVTWSVFLGIVCTVMMSQRKLLSDRFQHLRLAVFITVVASGLVPAAHWVVLHGGLSQSFVQIFLPRIVLLFASLGAGVLVYGVKFPEKCCPGYFDYVGASHQLWHCFVLIALISWHRSGLNLIVFLHTFPCEKIIPSG